MGSERHEGEQLMPEFHFWVNYPFNKVWIVDISSLVLDISTSKAFILMLI